MYPATPPAEGTARPSRVNTAASIAESPISAAQASIDAGPACAAASPGSNSRPGPSSAPM
ncbi:MAG TPA: hypothetical protein VGI37_04295 [Streptosporangiaceae bacterium]